MPISRPRFTHAKTLPNEPTRPSCANKSTRRLGREPRPAQAPPPEPPPLPPTAAFAQYDLTKHDRFYSRNSFIEFLKLDEVSTPRLMLHSVAVTRTIDRNENALAPRGWRFSPLG